MSSNRTRLQCQHYHNICANPRVKTAIGYLALVFLLAAIASLNPVPALAQQSGTEPYQVNAGPYRIEVIANPSALSLGSVRYTVIVLNAQNAQPVSDARVLIRARHQGEGVEGWATALNNPVTPESYQAQIELNRPGAWVMSVEVSSSLGRVAVEVPSHRVPEPRQSRAGGLVFASISGVLVLGSVYLVWSIRRAQQKREAANAS
jgi:hypothetical protein